MSDLEKVEGIIVGQGLAGTLLAHEMHKRSRKIMIIDDGRKETSSKIAAGLYNPITGRKMIKTWLADDIFPPLPAYYDELQRLTGARFHHPLGIYRPFHSMEEYNDWDARRAEPGLAPFIKSMPQSSNIRSVLDPFGGLMLSYSGYVDLPVMLSAFRELFRSQGMLLSELFQYDKLEYTEGEIGYGDLKANWIVFCEGPAVVNNPFFQSLRWRLVKGELIGIETETEFKHIVNRGVFMIPRSDFVQVGSTYHHDRLDWSPAEKGVQELKNRLAKLFDGAFEVVDERAGLRPATFDRRPFLGMLEKMPGIGIFNGLGTKGVSLGPHFAQLMTSYLLDGNPLPAEVSINR